MAISPRVDVDGNISFEVTKAEFGPIPAPMALTNALSANMTEAFAEKLGSQTIGIRVASPAIGDSQTAIVGAHC